MANFVITSKALENESFETLVTAVEVYLETLDSPNKPVVSINYVFNSKSGTYHASLLTS